MKIKIAISFFLLLFVTLLTFAQPGGGYEHPVQPQAKPIVVKLTSLPNVPFFDATQPFKQSPANPYLWVTYGYPYVTAYNTDERVWTMETTYYNKEYRFSVTVVGKDGVKTTYDTVTKVNILYNIYGGITKVQLKYIIIDDINGTYEEIGNFTHLLPTQVLIN